MTERERERIAPDVREEAALPLRQTHPPLPADERRAGTRVLAFALLFTILASIALEYGGWQIVRLEDPAAFGGIPWTAFVRGAFDTMLGAIGIGTGVALATLLVPSSWRRPWRRVAVGFLGGAAGFLGFLSWLTLPYFL